MISYRHVATFGTAHSGWLSGIADLAMARVGGTWLLFAVNATGGVSSHRLEGADRALVPVQVQEFPAHLTYGAMPQLTVLEMPTGYRLLLEGMAGAGVAELSVAASGGLGGIGQLFPADIIGPRLSASGQIVTEGGRFLFSARPEALTLEVHRIADNGGLVPVSSVAMPPAAEGAGASLDKVIAMTVDGQRLLVAASGLGNFVSTHTLGADGGLGRGALHAAAEGVGYDIPSDIAALQFGAHSFVVVAAAASSSLSVFRVGRDGGLTITDHVIDELTTRFQSVTALATVAVEGRGFVIAGGADGGISLFTLLPNGRLIHLDTILDTAGTTLSRISAIEAQAVDGRIALVVASAGETGITQFAIDPGALGATGIAGAGAAAGTARDDMLVAAAATTALSGGAGDDILVTGNADIALTGGEGADLFAVTRFDGRVTITDFEPGIDRLDLSMLGMIRSVWQLNFAPQAWGMRILYGNSILDVRTRSGEGLSPLDFGNAMFPVSHYWLPPPDPVAIEPPPATVGRHLFGTEGPDQLIGAGGADMIDAREGDDTVSGGGGADTIGAGAGHDQLRGGDGADRMQGGEGNDTLLGDGESDVLSGDDGADFLDGGADGDTLRGGAGDDLVHGGAGADRLDGDGGNDILSGDDGNDHLEDRLGDNRLIGGTGNDTLIAGDGADQLWGGDGNDLLHGGGGNDVLQGQGGNDSLWGGGGNDRIEALAGSNALQGEDGNDTLIAGIGADALRGGAGHDILQGGAGHDQLWGEDGTDVLDAEAGDDRLDGGRGDDVLLGRDGDDILTDLWDNNRLQGDGGDDSLRTGGGRDRLSGGLGNDLLLGGAGNDALSGDAGNDRLLGEAGDDLIQDMSGVNRLDGGTGHDRLIAGTGHDTLLGGDGNDSLRAGAGNDRLDGGAGNDTLSEEAGNDVLTDPSGNNFLWGGAGQDRLTGGTGTDRLSGDAGHDTLQGGAGDDQVRGGTDRDQLWGGIGNDAIWGDSGDDLLCGETGLDTLWGGTGRDILIGGAGADLLSGGADADVFCFRALSDSAGTAPDRITDFRAGTDDIDLRAFRVRYRDDDGFTGARQVRWHSAGAETHVTVDVTGDRQADFLLRLTGRINLDPDDFLL